MNRNQVLPADRLFIRKRLSLWNRVWKIKDRRYNEIASPSPDAFFPQKEIFEKYLEKIIILLIRQRWKTEIDKYKRGNGKKNP